MSIPVNYGPALELAIDLLVASEELEINSALKQAAQAHNIPEGDEMGAFVIWAEKEMGIS